MHYYFHYSYFELLYQLFYIIWIILFVMNYFNYFIFIICIFDIIAIIFLVLTASPTRHLVSDTEAVTQNAFVNITDSYCCKNIANSRWCVHFHFGQGPPQTEQTQQSTVFAPPQEEHRCSSEPRTRSNAYLTDAQPEDPSGSGIGHVYQTGTGSKHGELSCSHGTFLHVTLYVAQSHSQPREETGFSR